MRARLALVMLWLAEHGGIALYAGSVLLGTRPEQKALLDAVSGQKTRAVKKRVQS